MLIISVVVSGDQLAEVCSEGEGAKGIFQYTVSIKLTQMSSEEQ